MPSKEWVPDIFCNIIHVGKKFRNDGWRGIKRQSKYKYFKDDG